MSNKHSKMLGEWARENGHRKWDDLYHPENKSKRTLEGIKYYNRRHKVGKYRND